MHFTKLSFDDFMTKVSELLGISISNPQIVEAVGRFGYNMQRLREGDSAFRKVQQLHAAQEDAMKRKVSAHDERKKLHASVRKQYMKMLQIARIAFDGDSLVRKALQLDGPRETSLDKWINQVALFGNRLITEEQWAAALKDYGISTSMISALMNDVEKLRSVALICDQTKEDAKKQTALKKETLKALQDWISDYLKIAKIALDDHPNLYQQLKV